MGYMAIDGLNGLDDFPTRVSPYELSLIYMLLWTNTRKDEINRSLAEEVDRLQEELDELREKLGRKFLDAIGVK